MKMETNNIKLTDNEIIKALECCAKPYCNDNKCPLHKNTVNTKDCITQLSTNALDLINRQKAEIERLTELVNNSYKLKAEAVKEFAERLKEKSVYSGLVNAGIVYKCHIDNLFKEMVGEGK